MLICKMRYAICDAGIARRGWGVKWKIFCRCEETTRHIEDNKFNMKVEESSALKNRNRHSGCVPAADGLGRSLGLLGG